MKTCDYCGQKNGESVRFCQGCGTDLNPAPSPPISHIDWSRVSWARTSLIAFLGSLIVYLLVGTIGYFRMQAFQRTHLAWTDFPPAVAWIAAVVWAIVAFVVVFITGICVFRKRGA